MGTLIDTYGGDAYDLSVEPFALYSPVGEANPALPDGPRQVAYCTMSDNYSVNWGMVTVIFTLADTPAHAASLYAALIDPTTTIQLSETSPLPIRGTQDGEFGYQDFPEAGNSGASGDVLAGAATVSVYVTAYSGILPEDEFRTAITSAIEWALANPPMVA